MVTDELLQFVRVQYNAGMSASDLKALLIAEGGWDDADVDEAFQLIGIEHTTAVSPTLPISGSSSVQASDTQPVSSAPTTISSEALSSLTPSPTTVVPSINPSMVNNGDNTSDVSLDDFLGIFSADPSADPSLVNAQEQEKSASKESTGETAATMMPHVAEEQQWSPEAKNTAPKEKTEKEETPLVRLITQTPISPTSTPSAQTEKVTDASRDEQSHDAQPTKTSEISLVRFSLVDALRDAASRHDAPAVSSETSPAVAADTMPTTRTSSTAHGESMTEPSPSFVNIHLGPAPSGREQIVTIDPSGQTTETPPLSKPIDELHSQEVSETKHVVFNMEAIANTSLHENTPFDGKSANGSDPQREVVRTQASEQHGIETSVFARRTMASDMLLQKAHASSLPSPNPTSPASVATTPMPGATASNEAIAPTLRLASSGFSGVSSVFLSGMESAPASVSAMGKDAQESRFAVHSSATKSNHAPVDTKKPRNVKKILAVTLGVLLVVTGVSGALLMWRSGSWGPDAAMLMNTAVTQLLSTNSWSYESTLSINLGLTSSHKNSGMIERSFVRGEYRGDGSLSKNASGFGDGMHRIRLKGEMGIGDILRSTDVSLEVRRIGNTLFLHIAKAPEGIEPPPEFLKTYWIKIDLADLGRKLGWSGLELMGEGYGVFTGGSTQFKMENVIITEFPFVAKELTWTESNGARRATITLGTDPVRAVAFLQALYQKFMNKELLLSEEDRTQLSDVMRKIHGELIIDKVSGMPERLTLLADFDDTVFGRRMTGSVSFMLTPGGFHMPISVTEPSSTLSIEELQREIERHKTIMAIKARDDEQIAKLGMIREALEAYRASRGKYPLTLTELHTSGTLATTTVSTADLKEYAYAAYTDATQITKTGRCSPKGKMCASYHIGINLEYLEHPALNEDGDFTSDVRGLDTAGCTLEKERACYDLLAPEVAHGENSTSTPRLPS